MSTHRHMIPMPLFNQTLQRSIGPKIEKELAVESFGSPTKVPKRMTHIAEKGSTSVLGKDDQGRGRRTEDENAVLKRGTETLKNEEEIRMKFHIDRQDLRWQPSSSTMPWTGAADAVTKETQGVFDVITFAEPYSPPRVTVAAGNIGLNPGSSLDIATRTDGSRT